MSIEAQVTVSRISTRLYLYYHGWVITPLWWNISMSYKSNRCTGFPTRPLLVTYWPFGLGAVSGGYTEGMGPGTSSTLPLRISRSWIRGKERTNLPDAVLTSTVLTTPTRPGNSCVLKLSGHLNRGCWSSCTRTTEPSWRSHFLWAPRHGGKFLI